MVVLGVGAGVFTLLTSPWGWRELPGLLLYATLSPMMGSVILSIIKAYLSGTAVGGRRLGILGILTALWRIGDSPAETQKSLLLAGLRSSVGVGLVSSISSVSAVVGIHAGINAIPGLDSGGPGGVTASCAINCAINFVTNFVTVATIL
jgi:hypothetical protein